jgi:hypothetical protein
VNIPDAILENVRIDPLQSAIRACEFAVEKGRQGSDWTVEQLEILMEAYALVDSMTAAGLIVHIERLGTMAGDRAHQCLTLTQFLKNVRDELEIDYTAHRLEGFKAKYANLVSNTFTYEFTDGDVNRIQTLINELREIISSNDELEDQHKRRLLKRLEKLQAEMHKKMSDLDHFYGLTVEGSVMLKKVGGNLKPIVDRISEITKITWATQSRAEDLPSGTDAPLLQHESGTPQID